MADCAAPSPEGARALQHAQAAARRFGESAQVEAVALNDAGIQQLGIGLEPTVLVGDFVVAVGMAPPAGHLVRAIEAALAKEATA
jgi:protein-disulfide isomerase